MPIWLADEPVSFTGAFVIVPHTGDMARVLNRLKELNDAGANEADQPFSRQMLRSTGVVALDRLAQGNG